MSKTVLPKRTLRQFIKHASEIINAPRYFQLSQTVFNYSVRFIKYLLKRGSVGKTKTAYSSSLHEWSKKVAFSQLFSGVNATR